MEVYTVEISDKLLCLFSADVSDDGDRYVVEVPRREIETGSIEPGDTYRVALISSDVEATSEEMAAEAEETIISEAATEAAIDVAGYSDELLLNDLRGLLEADEASQAVLQAVVHRDGLEYDTVFVAEGFDEWSRGKKLREFYKQFDWLNEQKLATALAVGELTVMMGVFDETRMIRYLASKDQETLILIDPAHPLHVPPFERQVADIVEAKWER
jgi:hypothetical protein